MNNSTLEQESNRNSNYRFCSNCGFKLDEASSSCSMCGIAIEAVRESPTTIPVQTYPHQVKKKQSYVYIIFIVFSGLGVLAAAVVFFITAGWIYEVSLWIIGISLGVGSLFSGLFVSRVKLKTSIAFTVICYSMIIGLLFSATLLFSFSLDDYIILLKVTLIPFGASYAAGLLIRFLVEAAKK